MYGKHMKAKLLFKSSCRQSIHLLAVQGLKAQGKTVVLISHRPSVVSLADRLLILQNGTVQASGPRDGVMAALQKQREAAHLAGSSAQPS